MMREFLLALALVLVSVGPASAGFVNHDAYPVVAEAGSFGQRYLLDTEGRAWVIDHSSERVSLHAPGTVLVDWPVGVAEMLLWDLWTIVTRDGVVWACTDDSPGVASWKVIGHIETTPVSAEQGTVGGLKRLFGGSDRDDEEGNDAPE